MTTNTIDELMSRNPLDLKDDDIDELIAYYRKAREAGPRPKKETGPVAKIDLTTLGLKPTAPTTKITRRL